jgi:chaperonin GroEL (HSP60 family)
LIHRVQWVREKIGEGEKVFDVRGMVFQRHRDDIFRHWLLGFGSADLTVFAAGANARQIEMPNVFNIRSKLDLINTMLQELEVVKGR